MEYVIHKTEQILYGTKDSKAFLRLGYENGINAYIDQPLFIHRFIFLYHRCLQETLQNHEKSPDKKDISEINLTEKEEQLDKWDP